MPVLKFYDSASGSYKALSGVGPTGPTGPTGPAGTTGPLGGRALNRWVLTTLVFTNQTSYAVVPDATERAALTGTLVKASGSTRLIVTATGSLSLDSGVAQKVFLGLRVGGVDYDIAFFRFLVAPYRAMVTGTREITALAAGNYAIEPVFRADTASLVRCWSPDDFISWSAVETQ